VSEPREHPGLRLWILLPALLGLAFSTFLVLHAHRVNHGIDGFPLDDPWIHLTYARNLHDHHSFSYFPGERSTAGSTSPLYTLLLAVGFSVTRNEKVLSYVLGILFHAAFLAAAALWGRKQLGSAIPALAFALFLALDWRIAVLSVSGMETSLYLFLIALSFWSWTARRWTVLGIALGLGVWVRPDTFILAGVFLIAALLDRLQRSRAPRRGPPAPAPSVPYRTWLLPFAALVLLYFGFNFVTGGRLMPNTFAAKHAYYTTPIARFLAHGVRESFLSSGFWVITPLAVLAVALEAVRLARGRPLRYAAETGWALALPLAYVLYVPTAHRFSRYLVPALPAVALLGFAALREVTRWGLTAKRSFTWKSARGVATVLLLAVVVGAQAAGAPAADREYSQYCLYHYQRHERTGRWLEEHTQKSAVVATHDVGAIAYYSNRKIIDIVGLIQPDAGPHLHKPDYPDFLARWFDRERVTHLAFLENWMEVANEKPLWVADSLPEILSVYAWIPGRTLLVPERVSAMNRRAVEIGQAGDLPRAIDLLGQSIEISPRNSKTWYLLGVVYTMLGDARRAEAAYRNALELFPDYDDARAGLAYVLENQPGSAPKP
jgi:arabinofuranosyltransferase